VGLEGIYPPFLPNNYWRIMAKFFKYAKISKDFDYEDKNELDWISAMEEKHHARLVSTAIYEGAGPLLGKCNHTVYYFREED